MFLRSARGDTLSIPSHTVLGLDAVSTTSGFTGGRPPPYLFTKLTDVLTDVMTYVLTDV